ncbi:MAG: hypothetical protein ACOYN6_00225 [Ignavibacteria bacterium]
MKKLNIVVIIVITLITIFAGFNSGISQNINTVEDSLAFAEIGLQQPLENCLVVDLKSKYNVVYEGAIRNDPKAIAYFFPIDFGIGWYKVKETKYWVYYRLERADELGWE